MSNMEPSSRVLSTKETLEIEQAKGFVSARELSRKYGISLGRIYRIWRKVKGNLPFEISPILSSDNLPSSELSSNMRRIEENQQEILNLCYTILDNVDDDFNIIEAQGDKAKSLLAKIKDYSFILPIIGAFVVVMWNQRKSIVDIKSKPTKSEKEANSNSMA